MPRYQQYYTQYCHENADSRWAEEEEIKAALHKIDFDSKNISCSGVPFMSDGKTVYLDSSDNHTCVFGGSGSKKSRNIAIPQTLLHIMSGESVIVSDFKGEIFDFTSGFAEAHGYKVLVINIRDPVHSNHWNPFYEPWRLLHQDKNIDGSREMINDFLYDHFFSDNAKSPDPYWDEMGYTFSMGLCDILLNCANAEEATIKSLIYLRNNIIDECGYGLGRIIERLPKDSYTYYNLNAIAVTPDRTKQCIISMFDSKLRLFMSQPNITELLSGQDFDITKFGEEKTILYLISPDEKTTYLKLISNFIHQSYSILISYASQQSHHRLKKRVNFLLDEFAQLHYICDFPSAIAAARSRNIRFTLFVQSFHQLVSTYDDDAETIIGNTGNLIFLNSRELPLLNRISELCGKNQYEKPLISVSKLQRLKNKEKGEALILLGSCYPFISHLADISEYNVNPSNYHPVEIPAKENKSPLFDLAKLNNIHDLIC